jgi:hypothetical protein
MRGNDTARGRGPLEARSATSAAAPSQHHHLADAREALSRKDEFLLAGLVRTCEILAEVLEPIAWPGLGYQDFTPGTVPPPDYWVD